MKNKTGNVTRRKMLKFSMFAGAGIALRNAERENLGTIVSI